MYRKCAQCGLDFKTFASRPQAKFCSRECQGLHRRKDASVRPGDVFRQMTVISTEHRNARWYALVRCKCGKESWRPEIDLTRRAVSCSCLKAERNRKQNTTHGMSSSKTYLAWRMMTARCYLKTNKSYKDYGGRGITVCDRWRYSFLSFVEDMGVSPSGLSIDRINNNGNYEPGNCRWADQKTQQNNKRSNRLIVHNGQVKTVTQWAEEVGISTGRIHGRLKAGLPPDLVLSKERFVSLRGLA